MSLSGFLYDLARQAGKTASKIRDIEVIASGDPKKIGKRVIRKAISKESFKVAKSINRKIK
jgi:hypothetical protein